MATITGPSASGLSTPDGQAYDVKTAVDSLVTSVNANLNTAATYVDTTGIAVKAAQATWDFAVDGGGIAAHGLGITIPANSIIVGGIVDVQTTCTSGTDAGTGAISVASANDIVTAVAIGTGTPWDQGLQQVIPATVANAVKTTTAKEITFTIAVEAFTAGKFTVTLLYVPTLVNV